MDKRIQFSLPPIRADLPDPTTGNICSFSINEEWMPLITGLLMQILRAKFMYEGTPEQKNTMVGYAEKLFLQLTEDCPPPIEPTPITECCTEYPAAHPIIRFGPNDPFRTPNHTPIGYLAPPWRKVGTVGQYIPGSDIDDAVLTPESFPSGFLLFPPLILASGLPRFSIEFTGSGTVELHFLEIPLGGYALVVVDNDPLQANLINLSSVTLEDLSDLLLLGEFLPLLSLASLVQRDILEVEIDGSGSHRIDVTFLPFIQISATSPVIAGFGGGLRKVVLCGNIEPEEVPVPMFELDGCNLKWRPSETAEWEIIGNIFEGLAVSASTLAAGSSATVEINDCELVFGIPTGATGATGAQGPQGATGATGPQGEQGEQGEPGENAPIPIIGFNELGNSVYMKVDVDADGLWDEISPNLRGQDGENAPIPIIEFNELGNSVYMKVDTNADGNWDEISPNLRGQDGGNGTDGSMSDMYQQPTDTDYFCRAARVCAGLFLQEISTFDIIGVEFKKQVSASLQIPDKLYFDEKVPIGFMFPSLTPEIQTWFYEMFMDFGEPAETYREYVITELQCRLVNSWVSDPSLVAFIDEGEIFTIEEAELDNLLLAAYALSEEQPYESADEVVEMCYRLIGIVAYNYSALAFKHAVYYESNLSSVFGTEDCSDCMPSDWCYDFDLSDGLPASWHISVGSYDGTTGIDTTSNVYGGSEFYNEFILRIDVAEENIEIRKITAYYTPEWGTFHPVPRGRSSYEANALDNIFLMYEFDDVPNPMVFDGSQMLNKLYFRMAAGSNLGASATGSIKLTRLTIEGMGENPFGTSNC